MTSDIHHRMGYPRFSVGRDRAWAVRFFFAPGIFRISFCFRCCVDESLHQGLLKLICGAQGLEMSRAAMLLISAFVMEIRPSRLPLVQLFLFLE